MDANSKVYKCPLCDSILTREKWIKITGQWEKEQELIVSAQKKIEKYKKENAELEKKHKNDLKEAKKLAEESGIAKGIKKEKGERTRMSKMIQKQTRDIQAGNKKIQELERQLKEGKTPQLAGFDYEKEVKKMLAETFQEDDIRSTGKLGDVIQTVKFNNEKVGSILYECKKTEKYSNAFVKEIKRHQETAQANYAVIVTHAQKENKSRFFMEGDVVVIDPIGLLDVAFFLRNTLLEMHRMKLTKGQTEQKGRKILRYMQSGEFKKNMVGNLEKAMDAYNLLEKEVKTHKKEWEERLMIYAAIHQNTQNIRFAIGKIITGGLPPPTIADKFPSAIEPPQLQSGKPEGGL